MKKIFIPICFLLFIQSSFIGQNNWGEFYNQSFDYLYNCEYDKAIEYLEKAKELNPDNPAIYWRLTFAFWFKAEHDENLNKKELKKGFNQIFDNGVALCDSDSNDPEILFYLGGLYGNRVLFKEAVGQRDITLLKDTQQSREYLRKIETIQQDFYEEACGYLGIFNYGPILMSGFQEWLARKAGYKWDEKKGLEQIKTAMEHSKYSDDVKFLYEGTLMGLVKKKGRQDKVQEAVDLVNKLIKKYPRNPFLKQDLKSLKKSS